MSATERGAWKQLGLDPVAVTAAMHDPDKQNAQGAVLSVLAALNAKPAEQRAMLAQTLFADSGNAVQLLSQNLGDVNEAFSQVKDKDQYATSKVGDQSSVRQSALALSNTPQGQWNAQSARSERLAIASANAVSPSPQALSVAGASIDSMSEFAEEHPTTSAVIITVGTALKKIFDVILDAAVDEGKDRLRKRIPGGASATPGPFVYRRFCNAASNGSAGDGDRQSGARDRQGSGNRRAIIIAQYTPPGAIERCHGDDFPGCSSLGRGPGSGHE